MAKSKQKRLHYREASLATIRRAWSKAFDNCEADEGIAASSVDAGFILCPGTKPKSGYQVFVKVARYDEGLLLESRMTGGLIENR